MHHPHACFADSAWSGCVTVEENVPLARDTYRVRARAPEAAQRIVPGQFVMLRLPQLNDPLLGRPLALYDTVLDASGAPAGLDIVYLAIGKMTRRLATLAAGDALELWGPLGNGFPPTPTRHLVIVAGGIGQTPFVALARDLHGATSWSEILPVVIRDLRGDILIVRNFPSVEIEPRKPWCNARALPLPSEGVSIICPVATDV